MKEIIQTFMLTEVQKLVDKLPKSVDSNKIRILIFNEIGVILSKLSLNITPTEILAFIIAGIKSIAIKISTLYSETKSEVDSFIKNLSQLVILPPQISSQIQNFKNIITLLPKSPFQINEQIIKNTQYKEITKLNSNIILNIIK